MNFTHYFIILFSSNVTFGSWFISDLSETEMIGTRSELIAFRCLSRCVLTYNTRKNPHLSNKSTKATKSTLPIIRSLYLESVVQKVKSSGLYDCSNSELFKCKATKEIDHAEVKKNMNFLKTCSGRKVYLSKERYPLFSAWSVCCALGLRVVRFQSTLDANCIKNHLIKTLANTSDAVHEIQIPYFDILLQNEFRSCPDGILLPTGLWKKEFPSRNVDGNAFVSSLHVCSNCTKTYESGCFDHSDDGQLLRLLCEEQPLTITHGTGKWKNYKEQFVKQNENLCKTFPRTCDPKNRISVAAAVTEIGTCGNKVFYYTNVTRKNQYSMAACCNFGGLPSAKLETLDELLCLAKIIRTKQREEINNLQFVLSYVDVTFSKKFVYCGTNQTFSNALWSDGKPDNANGKQAFTNLVVRKTSQGIVDVFGSNLFPALCQVSDKTPTNLILLGACGSKIIFRTKSEFPANNSQTACCEAGGLNAVRIENKDVLHCIVNRTKKFGLKNPAVFNLNYMCGTLDNSFGFCGTNDVLPKGLWVPGEPNNAAGTERCTALRVSFVLSGIIDVLCQSKRQVLCEISSQN